ncbi:MAG: CDP-alcohol phosphatidyltransferase family protein [Deltaproteobacteria bacterium]|nr:CDP-alcohol phosphatidyltransferase family protein [Deltaproteobacteria bacterium]
MKKYIPNVLTVIRVLSCPIILMLFLRSKNTAGFAVFLGASLTDLFDGLIARHWRVCSRTGALLDALCDKLYSLSLFSLLMMLNLCPAWFLGFMIAASLSQGIGCLLLHWTKLAGQDTYVHFSIGKWNTAIQLVWIGVMLLHPLASSDSAEWSALHRAVVSGGYIALAFLQVAAFFRYFLHFRNQLIPVYRIPSNIGS